MKNLVVTALFTIGLMACTGKNQGQMVEESETDSLYVVNDSTVADLQTYQYEGVIPEGKDTVVYLLSIQSVAVDSNGTYKLQKSTRAADGTQQAAADEGQVVTLIGIPNDSTAIIYQLVSNTGGENTNFKAEGDTALTKVDKSFRKANTKANQTLRRTK